MSSYNKRGKINENDSSDLNSQGVIPLGSYKEDDGSAERKRKIRNWAIVGFAILGVAGLVIGLLFATGNNPFTPDDDTPQQRLESMLASAPTTTSKASDMWDKMTPMNFTFFEEYWDRANNESLNLTDEQAP